MIIARLPAQGSLTVQELTNLLAITYKWSEPKRIAIEQQAKRDQAAQVLAPEAVLPLHQRLRVRYNDVVFSLGFVFY